MKGAQLARYWPIEMSDQVVSWLDSQPAFTRERVTMALVVLANEGPNLGRPLVDSVAGSTVRNLKELRVSSSSRSAIRILFCFTPARMALLLVAGDKSGNWSDWYGDAIREAEELYEQYLED